MVANMLYFGIAIVVLTTLLVGGEMYIMVRNGKSWEDPNSLRILRIVLATIILSLGVFLVVAGFSSSQIGIMGVVIGYLFSSSKESSPQAASSVPISPTETKAVSAP